MLGRNKGKITTDLGSIFKRFYANQLEHVNEIKFLKNKS